MLMDRLLLAQKIYDFSQPKQSESPQASIIFEDPEGEITLSDLTRVLKRHFNAEFQIEELDREFEITYPRIHAARLKEVLSNYRKLAGTGSNPIPTKLDGQTREFDVILPTGITIDQIKRFLKSKGQTAYVEEQTGSMRYEFTTYTNNYDQIKQLVDFYLEDTIRVPSKKNVRRSSAFVQDVKFGNLPKEVQKDVKHFVHGVRNDTLLIQYGMVVSELLKKVDPENYKLAREHMRDKDNKQLEKEFYEKSADKYILIVNDRIVDGHHFLAKADKIGATRTLKILDLTPARFQKRNAQLLAKADDYIISRVNNNGSKVWCVQDDRGFYLCFRGTKERNWHMLPDLVNADAAEELITDYQENPELYKWCPTKTSQDMKIVARQVSAKLLPEFQDVYVGIDDGKHGIEVISVTESPFTHLPRINLFLMDPMSHDITQIGHIDTAAGHDTATRLTIIAQQDIHEEIQSLLSQLRAVAKVSYNDWREKATQLAEELTVHV